MTIFEVTNSEQKSEICNTILRRLPQWFGIESAILDYVRDVQKMETWVSQVDNEIVGFVSLNKHNHQSAEIHVMAVLEKHHRNKIGQKLVEKCEDSLRQQNFKFLQVKTLSPTRPDVNYDKTRQFYLKMNFTAIEEFKTLWGELNPCLLLIKPIQPLSKSHYAVIFTSQRTETDQAGYEKMSQRMVELAKDQKGFLGVESVRSSDGLGITVSYWLNFPSPRLGS